MREIDGMVAAMIRERRHSAIFIGVNFNSTEEELKRELPIFSQLNTIAFKEGTR